MFADRANHSRYKEHLFNFSFTPSLYRIVTHGCDTYCGDSDLNAPGSRGPQKTIRRTEKTAEVMRNRGRGAHAERALVCLCALAVVSVAGANNATNTTTAAAQGTPKPGSAIEDFRCSKCVTRTIRASESPSAGRRGTRRPFVFLPYSSVCDSVYSELERHGKPQRR